MMMTMIIIKTRIINKIKIKTTKIIAKLITKMTNNFIKVEISPIFPQHPKIVLIKLI